MSGPWSIPKTWQWTHIGEISSVVGGGTPDTHNPNYFGGDIVWLTPADLSGYTAKYISAGARNLTQAGLDNSGARLVPKGTVLFSSRAPIGYVAIAARELCTNQGFKSFVLQNGLDSDFVYYYLLHAKPLATKLASGTTFLEISAKNAAQIPIAIAAAAEQSRIADALDELFSDLDAGVAALKRARQKLKLYRASVLKAAVEGKLTAEWRAQHPHTEPASEPLKRILAERRRRWEEDQLAKFKAEGQEPPKNWKAKYKEPVAPDTTNLPPLPEGWCWVAFDQIVWSLRSGSAEASGRQKTDYPVLKSSAIRYGTIDFGDLNYLLASQSVRPENFLRPGDFLITRLSGSVDYVGCSAVVKDEACAGIQYPDRLFCGKLVACAEGAYVSYCFQHHRVRKAIEKAAKSTAGHQRVSMSDLRPLVLALPPLDEQHAIVEIVEDHLSVMDHLEADLAAKLKSAQSLQQALLRHAFSGKLVPQNPNDEPASELLKRIAAEREAREREVAAAKQVAKKTNGSRMARRG